MSRKRKQDNEAVAWLGLLILGLGAVCYFWNRYGVIVPVIIGSIVVVVVIIAVVGNVSNEKNRERKYRALQLADVDIMNGIEFERYVAGLLRHQGYQVEVTKPSGDFGVDVIAKNSDSKYAIQVKRHNSPVSRRAVSDAVAGREHYNCTAAMVVTNNRFTKAAMQHARSTGCELINRDALAKWILDYQAADRTTNLAKSESEMRNRFTSNQWMFLAILGVIACSVYGCVALVLVLE